MIIGLGIDLVEHGRFERELARSDWLPDEGIFRREEISYCRRGSKPAVRYAACFAAKEAVLKALGKGPSDLASFGEAQVRLGGAGSCDIQLHGRLKREYEQLGAKRITVSIAHDVRQTVAVVILEA